MEHGVLMNQDGKVLQDSQGKPKRVVLGEDGRTIFGKIFHCLNIGLKIQKYFKALFTIKTLVIPKLLGCSSKFSNIAVNK